uniref:deoxyribose-phosphate aldolase n=1 Tax=Phlebotomus kandelakii TaxID=1109342 RepID=A0A6B2E6Z7_9DIPT
MEVQKPIPFEPSWFEQNQVNLRSVEDSVKLLVSRNSVSHPLNVKAWALKALTLTDLTTLSGDDTKANVLNLCLRAAFPFPEHVLDSLGLDEATKNKIHTAAVCVYPSRVPDARQTLSELGKLNDIPIAAVATGFPSGQYPLSTRLEEIKCAIESGATEIDIVIDRGLALQGHWQDLYNEILAMRRACGNLAHLKAILGIGELGTMKNVYMASMVAMMAGADFIKTSTGKESVNATLPVGLVMIRAIQDFQRKTGKKIGLKPAGGVRTVKEAIAWMTLIKETLGNDWLQPHLFRFGASGLLGDIEKVVLS